MSKLVSITSHARYMPNTVALACGKLMATRAALGLSETQFGAALGPLVGWEPAPDTIRSWERGAAPPPGDVIMACDLLVTADSSAKNTNLSSIDFLTSGQALSDEGVTAPCRSADGRIIWVTIPRRTFLIGGVSATAGMAMRPVTRSANQIASNGDISPVEHLQRMRQMLVDSDNLLGPGHIIPTVHEHIAVIRQLRIGRSGADSRALLHLQAEYAEFAGWLHQDSGDFPHAQFWLDRALEWSQAAADQEMTTYVMARKSQLAGDMRDPQNAVDLAEAAVALARPGSRLHATAQTYKAHGYALGAESTQALNALDEATNLVAVPDDGYATWATWLDEAYINVQRGRCLSVLGSNGQAAKVFQQAIQNLPPSFRRDRGVYLAREAQAYAGADEPEHAAAAGIEALAIAEETRSGRIVHELAELDGCLSRWGQVPAIAAFRDALTSIIPEETAAS